MTTMLLIGVSNDEDMDGGGDVQNGCDDDGDADDDDIDDDRLNDDCEGDYGSDGTCDDAGDCGRVSGAGGRAEDGGDDARRH